MASNNPLTAVHYSLVAVMMILVVVGMIFYRNYQTLQNVNAKAGLARTEFTNQDSDNRQLDDDLKELKRRIGYPETAEVGLDSADDDNSMLNKMRANLEAFGGVGLPQPTFSAVIAKTRQELDNISEARVEEQADFESLETRTRELTEEYQTVVLQYEGARDSAQGELNRLEQKRQVALKSKDDIIKERVAELRTQQNELAQIRDDRRIEVAELKRVIGELERINDIRQEEVDQITQVSFETADGVIRWVDHVTRVVWISVGEADHLPKRTNFSIYTKSHHGIGRGGGEGDIKGAIEVTRLLPGGHLAEARILVDDVHRPITVGDPIYTPIWSPGRREQFALAGLIDIDGDGQSDRQLLHDVIAAAGSRVVAEIDDEGELLGDPISVHIKFIVVGEIPDPIIGTRESDKAIAIKIGQEYKNMIDKARKQGVRRVDLKDFLTYMGYKPQRRLWKPGQQSPFKLRAGAHSTGVDETVGDRSSSGQVSGAFNRDKRLKQQSSSGQTSKAYGSGGR